MKSIPSPDKCFLYGIGNLFIVLFFGFGAWYIINNDYQLSRYGISAIATVTGIRYSNRPFEGTKSYCKIQYNGHSKEIKLSGMHVGDEFYVICFASVGNGKFLSFGLV
jgi:hypothetical protein